ncbi:hypothetical protein MUCCIDRAFT_107411 [Mucor lusitanicus CBS 277.49]|uniref:Uncharacterized protein n=1 Tax=Mucor lusitanicus CBS 277.49 TaxID=747725 RepID=A0A162RKK5_MUCCL|nr:hypothetical protein MUCCIDRAFT_107411 [Mucor lusitanicus CBS 277.49]
MEELGLVANDTLSSIFQGEGFSSGGFVLTPTSIYGTEDSGVVPGQGHDDIPCGTTSLPQQWVLVPSEEPVVPSDLQQHLEGNSLPHKEL